MADMLPARPHSAPENDARPTAPARPSERLRSGAMATAQLEEETEMEERELVLAMAAPARRKAPQGARPNLYQEVTDRIVEMIENGTAPWQRPWDRPRHPNAPTRPVNAATSKPYHGINVLLLAGNLLTADDPRWCGYEQAKTRGWQVQGGARGASVYFFKRLEIDDARDPDGEPLLDEDGLPLKRSIPLLRRHTVFHASQIEGIPSLEEAYGPMDTLPDHIWDVEERLEALLRRSGARITHEGSIAVYQPKADRILLPPRERFPDGGAYYGVAYHELAHWTGHETRLNRPIPTQRHSREYAREELRAELASAFLGAELGIQHDLEAHAAYLDSYLDLLRQDNREIFRAARDAQSIADLILDRHPTWQLRQGVCVARTDPSPEALVPTDAVDAALVQGPTAAPPPETAETPAADVAPPVPLPEPDEPPRKMPDLAATAPALATPYRWAVAALCDLETADAEGGDLGRFSRWIDAALPLTPAPGEAPVVVCRLSGAAAPSH